MCPSCVYTCLNTCNPGTISFLRDIFIQIEKHSVTPVGQCPTGACREGHVQPVSHSSPYLFHIFFLHNIIDFRTVYQYYWENNSFYRNTENHHKFINKSH